MKHNNCQKTRKPAGDCHYVIAIEEEKNENPYISMRKGN